MSKQTTEEIEREEIEMLLPWYATGKLDRADVARVESYLARHPQISAQLDLIRAEREQVVLANDALGSPSAEARDRLMASLATAKPAFFTQRIAGSALWQRVSDFFAAPTARSVQWAALAAAALIVVQAATITSLVVGGGGDSYQTASGQTGQNIGNGLGKGVFALVVFADDAKASEIARLLGEFDARIVEGPKPGGAYKIRVRTADQSPAAQEAVVRQLAQRSDIIRTVLPSRD